MSKAKSAPSDVRVNLISDEKVYYEDDERRKLVGQHGRDSDGQYVYVMWQSLCRPLHSFTMSRDVFQKVDERVQYIFVVDKETKDLYKFTYETYRDAPTGDHDNLAPERWEFIGFWESCAEQVFRGLYD